MAIRILALVLVLASCTTVSKDNLELAIEYYNLAQIYEELSRNRNDIIPLYQKALSYYPAYEEAAYSLTILYIESEEFEEAEQVINSLSLPPNSLSLQRLRAYIAISNSNLSQAEDIYLDIIASEMATYDIHYNLGLLYTRNNEEELALEQFNSALELNATHIPTLEQASQISYNNNNYVDVAVKLESQANSLVPYPLASLLFADSLIQLESYAQLFELMDSFISEYALNAVPPNLRTLYTRVLRETAYYLSTIAIDDERSLMYYEKLAMEGSLSSQEWTSILESLENASGIDDTISHITDTIEEVDTAQRTQQLENFLDIPYYDSRPHWPQQSLIIEQESEADSQ